MKPTESDRAESESPAVLEDPGQAIVSARGIKVVYDEKTVLDGIDLDVKKGEIFVVVGPSGCGKSTLLRNLVGLERPREGKVLVKGRDVQAMDDDDYDEFMTGVGMLFQSGALFNSMTVGENVALPLREHTKLGEEEISSIVRLKLSLVGLAKAVDKLPSELSGGMRKRAAISRAIALDPEIIFFDELSAGLDPLTASELDELVLRLQSSLGVTMVVVSHELASIKTIADRIAVMSNGKIVACGTEEELHALRGPHADLVRRFLDRAPERKESWIDRHVVS